MTSIVDELRNWARNNSTMLRERAVQLTERFPEPNSEAFWKAGIGLKHGDILVSYTVWERTILQTTLIVMNTATKKTIVVEDANPEGAEQVNIDLDIVTKKLLDDSYAKMEPDPKLIIT
jgi:hypothetical protein